MEINDDSPEDVKRATSVEREVKRGEKDDPFEGYPRQGKKKRWEHCDKTSKKSKKPKTKSNGDCCETRNGKKGKAKKFTKIAVFGEPCSLPKLDIIPRHCLTKEDYIELLASPRRQCPPDCEKKTVLRRLRPVSRRIKELAKPPRQRMLISLKQGAAVLPPALLDNLARTLENESCLSPEQAAIVSKKKKLAKKQKEKKRTWQQKETSKSSKSNVGFPIAGSLDKESISCQYLMAERFVKSILKWKCSIPKSEFSDISKVIVERLVDVLEYIPSHNEDRKWQQLRALADMIACWISGVLADVASNQEEKLEDICKKKAEEWEAAEAEEDEEEDEDLDEYKDEDKDEDRDEDEDEDEDAKKAEDDEYAEEDERAAVDDASIVDDTKVEDAETETKVEEQESKAVETDQLVTTEAGVETELTEAEAGTEPPEAEVKTELTEAGVKTEPTEAEIGTQPTEAEVKTELTEAGVKTEPTEAEAGTQPTEAEVKTELTEAAVKTEPTEAEIGTQPTEAGVKPELMEAEVKTEPTEAEVGTGVEAEPMVPEQEPEKETEIKADGVAELPEAIDEKSDADAEMGKDKETPLEVKAEPDGEMEPKTPGTEDIEGLPKDATVAPTEDDTVMGKALQEGEGEGIGEGIEGEEEEKKDGVLPEGDQIKTEVSSVPLAKEKVISEDDKWKDILVGGDLEEILKSDIPFVTFSKIIDTIYKMIENTPENTGKDPITNAIHRVIYEKLTKIVAMEEPTLLTEELKDVVDVVCGKIANWLKAILTKSQVAFMEECMPVVESKEIRDWTKWLEHISNEAIDWNIWLRGVIEKMFEMRFSKMTRGEWKDWTKSVDTGALLWRRFHLETIHQAHRNITMMIGRRIVKTGTKTPCTTSEQLVAATELEA